MRLVATLLVLAADGGSPSLGAQYALDAKALRQAGDYDGALEVLKRCLALEPHDLDCLLMRGSVLATRGAKLNSSRDNAEAIRAYREFLVHAPADHRLVPRVRSILDDAPSDDPSTPFVPPSQHDYMPARVTVKAKDTVMVPVATILQLTNDAPDVADAVLSDVATMKIRGLKKGAANLRLTLADGSWHALRVEVR